METHRVRLSTFAFAEAGRWDAAPELAIGLTRELTRRGYRQVGNQPADFLLDLQIPGDGGVVIEARTARDLLLWRVSARPAEPGARMLRAHAVASVLDALPAL